MQRVIVQADRASRMNADDILNYNVKNSRGQLVPFSAFATVEWSKGPTQIAGFNYYPAVRISGEAKPGFTSGDAIAEMERLAGKLPRGFGYEWTGQSLQEKLSGSQAPFLLGLSVLVVFLLLAALYESWTIPLAVLLTVPLGICGAVIAATMRGLPNDVYFTVGLITIIGLAAKDAILIIEFAKDLRAQGKPLVEATIEACSLALPPDPDDGPRLRLRRAADGDRHRRRRRQPAGARHQRDGRHDRGGDPGAVDGAGVLRQRAARAGGGPGEGGGGGSGEPQAPAARAVSAAVVHARVGGHPVLSADIQHESAAYWIIRLRAIDDGRRWLTSPAASVSSPIPRARTHCRRSHARLQRIVVALDAAETMPPASRTMICPAAMSQGCRLRSQ